MRPGTTQGTAINFKNESDWNADFTDIGDLIVFVNCKNEDAIFTHRLSTEKQQKIIGSDSYISLCRYCYLSLN